MVQNIQALSVTGHRWHKLPFGTNEADPRCVALMNIVTGALTYRIEGGVSHIICGMALGFDTLVAEAVIDLKQSIYPHIILEAALFCPEQAARWTPEQRRRFERILEHCQSPPTITSPAYFEGCEMVRNRYMVDNSGVLLAAWDGRPSGTGKTVLYAREVGVPVIHINPADLGRKNRK